MPKVNKTPVEREVPIIGTLSWKDIPDSFEKIKKFIGKLRDFLWYEVEEKKELRRVLEDYRHTQNLDIQNPNVDTFSLLYTDRDLEIVEARMVVRGVTPSVTYQVKHATTRDASSTSSLFRSSQVVTNTSAGAAVTDFRGGVKKVPKGSFIWLDLTAVSGTVDEALFTLTYKEV